MKPNFLFVDVFPGKLGKVYSELGKRNDLNDISIVLGEHDIIAKTDTEEPERLYKLCNNICAMPDVKRAGVYSALKYMSGGSRPEEFRYRAWVLIRTRDPETCLEKLMDIDGMVEACSISGPWSIIADMACESFEDLGRNVVKIQGIKGVTRTETLAAFPKELVEEISGLVVAH